MGFAVESELHDLKKKDNVTASQIKVFMKTVQRFLCAMVTKLLDEAHLGQWFCYQPPCLILTLLNASKEKRSPCLKNLLKHLLELNILSTKQCDVTTTEFKKFLDVEVKTMQRELVTFLRKLISSMVFISKLQVFQNTKICCL